MSDRGSSSGGGKCAAKKRPSLERLLAASRIICVQATDKKTVACPVTLSFQVRYVHGRCTFGENPLCGAEEAWGAHNPQVVGSKPTKAIYLFVLLPSLASLNLCVATTMPRPGYAFLLC